MLHGAYSMIFVIEVRQALPLFASLWVAPIKMTKVSDGKTKCLVEALIRTCFLIGPVFKALMNPIIFGGPEAYFLFKNLI
jgi:hypothetical protein